MNLKTSILTIEELSEEIEFIKWGSCNFTFKITEVFNGGTVTYYVEDLAINQEDDVIWASDSNDCIRNNAYSLLSFLRKRLIRIHKVLDGGDYVYHLILSNGIIIIESVNHQS